MSLSLQIMKVYYLDTKGIDDFNVLLQQSKDLFLNEHEDKAKTAPEKATKSHKCRQQPRNASLNDHEDDAKSTIVESGFIETPYGVSIHRHTFIVN